jgi:hypothetical protein
MEFEISDQCDFIVRIRHKKDVADPNTPNMFNTIKFFEDIKYFKDVN